MMNVIHLCFEILFLIRFILDAWEAVNPWYEKIPAQEREEYWNDFHSYVCENGYALDDYKENPQSCRYKDPYKWMVAYAQK